MPRADAAPGAVEVHFSPRHDGDPGCEATVVGLIDGARRTVRLSAYSFTSKPVLAALARAEARGVDVALVLDRSDEGHEPAAEMRRAGVAVAFDEQHRIAHSKFVVIDGAVVETGSFNYSHAAEASNAENCVVLRDTVAARRFGDEWARHKAHAEEMR